MVAVPSQGHPFGKDTLVSTNIAWAVRLAFDACKLYQFGSLQESPAFLPLAAFPAACDVASHRRVMAALKYRSRFSW